jgi:hypothetical protein
MAETTAGKLPISAAVFIAILPVVVVVVVVVVGFQNKDS